MCQPARQLAGGQSVPGTCILTGSTTLGEELTCARGGSALPLPESPQAHGRHLLSPYLGAPRIHSLQFRDQLLPRCQTEMDQSEDTVPSTPQGLSLLWGRCSSFRPAPCPCLPVHAGVREEGVFVCEGMSVCMSECRYAHECKSKSVFVYMYTCV